MKNFGMANYKKQFAKVYDKHVEKIYRFVFLKIGSKETAEDITAQVFTKGWKKIRTGGEVQNLPAYLYQIARAEVANHYREGAKFQTVSAESLQVVDQSVDIEGIQQLRADTNQIKIALSRLTEDYQNILIWRFTDGHSNKEIAQMLDKSEGAVRVMMHRALEELRKLVGD